jgi:hypothetical protein
VEAQAQDRIHRLGQHARPWPWPYPNPTLIKRLCRNPAVEAQAQDRIHRLGQHKPIHVTRFVIGGTIEERILKLQARPYPTLHLGARAGQRGALRRLLPRWLAVLSSGGPSRGRAVPIPRRLLSTLVASVSSALGAEVKSAAYRVPPSVWGLERWCMPGR